MSAPPDLAETATASLGDLAALRAELDRLDDALQDLLIERGHAVVRIAESGGKGRVALRPGREAAIIRRLLSRHSGPLAPQVLVRIWRELLAGTTAMQGPHLIAVCDGTPGCGLTQTAREHFGALTPVRVHRRPTEALLEARTGTASAAVLPMPSESEAARDAWWTDLLYRQGAGEARLHVVGRLPFWSPRPEGAPREQGLIVSAIPPDPSGHDRSLVGLETKSDIRDGSLTVSLAQLGLRPEAMILGRDGDAAGLRVLVEIEGFVSETDPRLSALGSALGPASVLGAYAVPVEEAA